MTGQGRLAVERVPHAGAAAVLRRHVLPAGAAPWHAWPVDAGAGRRSPSHGRNRERDLAPAASALRERLSRRSPAVTVAPSRWQESALEQALTELSQRLDARNGGFGNAPKFPQAPVLEFLLLGDVTRDGAGRRCYAMAQRRHPRPTRRWLRALQRRRDAGRCRTSRRCSTTTRCSRAPTCTAGSAHRDPRLRTVCIRHVRLGAAGDARSRGRLLQRARRRLRGHRGSLLRLERRAAR